MFKNAFIMPKKPYITVYYFSVVKMEEKYAIAVSFGKNVRNSGFCSPLVERVRVFSERFKNHTHFEMGMSHQLGSVISKQRTTHRVTIRT